ncbi:MAG TPA: hypothetical protein VG869_06590 [Acidimicrobiia bacterium]|jgi:hypothetical protein|nr:hypothetical protein [Acidimicrobiia bacterium]
MADWLVPLSRRTNFIDRSGATLTPRFEVVRNAALAGELASVDVEVRGALADAEPGDTVWVLWSEHDVGVMAVGQVRRRHARHGGAPELSVALDKARTRLLVVDPMPTVFVRRWIPDLRGGSRLDHRPRAYEVIQSWEQERGARDDDLLRPLGLQSWRARAGRGTGDRPVDDPALASVVPFLRSQDFAVGVVARDGGTRLVARRSRDLLVIHAVAVDRDRAATYQGFGLVRAHRWSIERTHADLHVRAWPWLVYAAKPAAELIAFLEDEGVLVTWRQASGQVEMSDRSKQRWYRDLGVR